MVDDEEQKHNGRTTNSRHGTIQIGVLPRAVSLPRKSYTFISELHYIVVLLAQSKGENDYGYSSRSFEF